MREKEQEFEIVDHEGRGALHIGRYVAVAVICIGMPVRIKTGKKNP